MKLDTSDYGLKMVNSYSSYSDKSYKPEQIARVQFYLASKEVGEELKTVFIDTVACSS